ncbi:MAG: hypothetical protein DCC68_15175 [Planctomycetota bacterium]|nr:MAG: hypothetical protein DCC68_15175 [Planctomycetota bacterium]
MADRSPQRIVRRLEVGRRAPVDEQLWPVNVALLLLAAFVEGVVIARLEFVDPRPLYNAWTWTATLLFSVGIGVWLVQRLDNRHVRRSVQLATVLSLLFHAILAVVLNKDLLVAWLDEPEPQAVTEELREITVSMVAPDALPQDFEEPVATPTPDANDQTQTRVDPPVEPQPTTDPTPPAPMPDDAVAPNIPQLNRPDQTTPRRSDTQGQLSRNPAPSPDDPRTQASAPPRNSSSQPRPNELNPTQSPSRRETAGPQTPRPAAEAPTTADAQRPELPSRTPQSTTDVAQSSSAPALPRRTADPVQPPTTAIRPQDLAGPSRQTAPNAPDPRTVAERSETNAPTVDRSANAPEPQPNEAVRVPNASRQPRNDNIAAAQPIDPTNPASRARPMPNPSAVAAAEGPATPAASPAVAPSLEPRAPSAERSTASTPSLSSATLPAPDGTASVAPGASADAGARVERATDSDAAGALAQTSRDNRRAAIAPRSAADIGSPAQAVQPRLAQNSEQGPRPSPSPGNVAERQATGGIAGQGRSANLDAGPGALQHPGRVPSDSAVRPSPTQTTERGVALSPSQPALVGKRRADASLPSSTLQAQPAPNATVGGSTAPALNDADSSLAEDRASANAPQGRVSADRGSASVDVGPRQIVGEGASGRPSGGGQPNVGDIARSTTPTRRTPGGEQPTLLDSANPTVVAEAPRASGTAGSSTGTGEPQPGTLAAERSQSATSGATGGATAGEAPSGAAVAAETPSGPVASGRPNGAGEETLVSTPGVVREGRRTTPAGIPDIGPATAPQLAGGPANSSGEPGNPSSAGTPSGEPLDQTGRADTRSTAGLAGRSLVGPSGAEAGPPVANVVDSGRPGDVAGRRDPLGGIDPGSAVASAGGGSKRRTPTADLPSGIGSADAPSVAIDNAAGSEPGELPDGTFAGEPSRREGGPQSFVRAETGPGGLGALPAPEAGIAARRARIDVPDIALDSTRQAERKSIGLPAIDGQVRMAIDSYRLRRARRYRDAEIAGAGQPSPKTEEAVESGLEFLTRSQSPDGSWSLHDYRGKPPVEQCRIHSDTAATGLALLAYLGAGYDHYGDKYESVIRGGLEWLINQQAETGNLYLAQDAESNRSAQLYSHAIAAIALCEAYGMTGDERLKEPAQRAIDFIVRSQHPELGGWRYSPIPNTDTYDSDTSVSGWMVMALRSAELAKLNVPRESFQRVEGWLDRATARGSRGAKYVYWPKGPKPKDHDESPQMTSIGLLMRMYLGWDRTKPEMVRGADYLAQTLPRAVENASGEWQGAYYWYYATQVMFHMRGEHWQTWNERLHPLLTQSQRSEGPLAGSWDPDGPASDMWARFGGRIYVTTLNLLSLEVYYRHLPIYEDTAR